MAASVTRLVISTAIAATISTSYARQVRMILSLYYVHVLAVHVWNFFKYKDGEGYFPLCFSIKFVFAFNKVYCRCVACM